MKRFSKKEKKELKISSNPLRQLRVDLRDQGMTLESFLELCFDSGLNPLPMLRARGINIRYYKDTSYCDVSVHHDDQDRVVLNYPDYSRYEDWYRFHCRYQELVNTAERKRIQKQNRPHRVVRKQAWV